MRFGALAAIAVLAFVTCGQVGPTSPVLVYSDDFDETGAWVLHAEENSTEISDDSAEAAIADGVLKLCVAQDFGCPGASATLDIAPDVSRPECEEWALEIDVRTVILIGMGVAWLEITTYAGTMDVWLDSIELMDGAMLTISSDPEGQALKGFADGAPLEMTSEWVEGSPSSIRFEVEACGADAYAAACLVLDGLRLFVT